MYDMYPDSWGPAKNDPESPYSQAAVQRALDRRDSLRDSLRDGAALRPDDN